MSTSEDKPQEQVEESVPDLEVTDQEDAEQVKGGTLAATATVRAQRDMVTKLVNTNPPPGTN